MDEESSRILCPNPGGWVLLYKPIFMRKEKDLEKTGFFLKSRIFVFLYKAIKRTFKEV